MRPMDELALLARSLELALFPARCALGGEALPTAERVRLCRVCRDTFLPNDGVRCPRCDLPACVPTGEACHGCVENPPEFVSLRAPYLYEGPAAELIRRIKLDADEVAARTLAELFLEAPDVLSAARASDTIVPVPLGFVRLWRRGFNQAGVLARALAQATHRRVEYGLVRVRRTQIQRRLDRDQRAQNVQGAFRARPGRFAGRRVLLVDDVVTTGATVRACTRALVNAGALEVHVVAVARTPAGP